MSELNTDARKVLQAINDLQFVGRPGTGKAEFGNRHVYIIPTVPIYVLHGELFDEQFSRSFDLVSTLKLLKTQEAVIHIVNREFQNWKYVRPDGKTVAVKCLFNGNSVSPDVTVDGHLVSTGFSIMNIDCYQMTKTGREMLGNTTATIVDAKYVNLNDMEFNTIQALVGKQRIGEKLAKDAGYTMNSTYKGILSGMVRRELLNCNKGYSIHPEFKLTKQCLSILSGQRSAQSAD